MFALTLLTIILFFTPTTFNRLHRDKSGMTVSKSWCADKIHKYRYEIRVIRKHLKHRKPKPMPKNIIWATDLTTVTDENGNQLKVLAFIDHGTRSCLFLEYMTTISSIAVLDTTRNYREVWQTKIPANR